MSFDPRRVDITALAQLAARRVISVDVPPIAEAIATTKAQEAVDALDAVYQLASPELTALAGLTSAEDTMPYYTGEAAASTTGLTAFARTLLDDADAATARATLAAAGSGAATASGLEVSPRRVLGRFADGTGPLEEIEPTSPLEISATGELRITPGTLQAASTELDALAALTSTAFGRALLELADAAALRKVAKVPFRVQWHASGNASLTLTNHPSTEQHLLDSLRNIQMADLADATEVRFHGRVSVASASANTPRLLLKYATTFQNNPWNYLHAGDAGAEVAVSLSTAGYADSGWVTLNTAARIASCFLTVTQIGGDSTADPILGYLASDFR